MSWTGTPWIGADLNAFRACLSPVRRNGARRVLRGRWRSNAPPLPDWKPFYYLLEDELDVMLVNARALRNMPGRKSDVSDAAWLADLGAHGLVRASLVPPPPIRQLRDLTRARTVITCERSREAQRLEKLLEDAGVKLTSVVSNITGVSSRAMLEALIEGEQDPAAIAELVHPRMRPKIPAARVPSAALRAVHELFVAGEVDASYLDSIPLRRVVAESWQRSLAKGVDSDRGGAQSFLGGAERGPDARRPSVGVSAPGHPPTAGRRRDGIRIVRLGCADDRCGDDRVLEHPGQAHLRDTPRALRRSAGPRRRSPSRCRGTAADQTCRPSGCSAIGWCPAGPTGGPPFRQPTGSTGWTLDDEGPRPCRVFDIRSGCRRGDRPWQYLSAARHASRWA
jgi:Transposase